MNPFSLGELPELFCCVVPWESRRGESSQRSSWEGVGNCLLLPLPKGEMPGELLPQNPVTESQERRECLKTRENPQDQPPVPHNSQNLNVFNHSLGGTWIPIHTSNYPRLFQPGTLPGIQEHCDFNFYTAPWADLCRAKSCNRDKLVFLIFEHSSSPYCLHPNHEHSLPFWEWLWRGSN